MWTLVESWDVLNHVYVLPIFADNILMWMSHNRSCGCPGVSTLPAVFDVTMSLLCFVRITMYLALVAVFVTSFFL